MSEPRTVYVLLPGKKEDGDHYQLLQEEVAVSEGRRLGLRVEVAYAPGFDQLRVLKKRLLYKDDFPDAVVTEPSGERSLQLVLDELQGRMGLLLLNAWSRGVEQAAAAWGGRHPFGTVSTDHVQIGRIQGGQARSLLRGAGTALCVTGPRRSSAAQERFEAFRSEVGSGIEVFDTEGGQWTEAAGITAFNDWYRVFKARNPAVGVIAAQSDELAMGVRGAIEAVADPAHREALGRAALLGVDACPGYGQRLVNEKKLTASIFAPANTGLALELLHRFWTEGRPVPVRSLTEAQPYPASSHLA